MAAGKITKTEWLLLGLTAVFLCGLLALYACDRAALASSSVETDVEMPQEAFMPELAPLDLNDASAEELTELPGIGRELARRIVAYREEHGPFESVEELMEVSGIGQGKLDGLEGRVTVENEGTT
ncbi:ComEA family DNA-binding protein [Dysosmobacter sp.]|uniref:ComEA family DNA-binding protein n=1 Tax=Dysosmobacter sp. TaxID=2591382 RepID=UPI002A97B082|nr:helix-hairpin-helix domain-containing protein [Dysosmobacter sp.]MDY5611866.1 helix-hairpin-helix domain-containing protein [Dysosmobacter sp.]